MTAIPESEASAWKDAGFSLEEAAEWHTYGFSPVLAARWAAAGFHPGEVWKGSTAPAAKTDSDARRRAGAASAPAAKPARRGLFSFRRQPRKKK